MRFSSNKKEEVRAEKRKQLEHYQHFEEFTKPHQRMSKVDTSTSFIHY
jgi:hypothetical protein